MAKFTHDSLAAYRTCPGCGAEIEHLVVGGVGDWRTRIVCDLCGKIQRGVPYDEVIVPLAACKHETTQAVIRNADSISQDEYERIILGEKPMKDLPAVPKYARWLARRLENSR
jgi:hypothetical protein